MSKPSQITYEIFVEATHQLEQEGQRVSVRAVRHKIGGSNSKLMEYLRQWREEKRLATKSHADMSNAFRQALLAEFGRVVQSTREQLEKQLTDEENTTQEALGLLAELENRCNSQEEKITELEQHHRRIVSEFDKQIAGLKVRVMDGQSREQEFAKEIDALRVSQHQAQVDAAVAKKERDLLKEQLEKSAAAS